MSKDDVVAEVLNSIREMEDNQIKLLDGYYKVNDNIFESWKVTGTDIKPKDPHDIYDIPMSVTYGDFGIILFMEYFIIHKQISASGEAAEKITDVVGKCRYNAKISYSWDMNNQDDEGNPRVIDNKALILLRELSFPFRLST